MNWNVKKNSCKYTIEYSVDENFFRMDVFLGKKKLDMRSCSLKIVNSDTKDYWFVETPDEVYQHANLSLEFYSNIIAHGKNNIYISIVNYVGDHDFGGDIIKIPFSEWGLVSELEC